LAKCFFIPPKYIMGYYYVSFRNHLRLWDMKSSRR
jgi:hypothetical protein